MFARVTRFAGTPEQLEDGLRIYREQALPWLADASGFRGFVALLDKERRRGLGITFWATEEAAEDAARSGANLRDLVIQHVGSKLEGFDVFEVAHAQAVQLDDLEEA